MRRRVWGATFARVLVLATVAGAALGVGHVTAPAARAECDGGYLFDSAVASARAAIVGRVATISTHVNGLRDVTAVRVEHAYDISPGTVYKGRATSAWCADYVRIGSRVVVLVGFAFPEVAGRSDIYYVVGQSITAAQAARVGLDLPDTDAIAPAAPLPSPSLPWAALAAGGAAFVLATRRRPRRVRGV